ncbi:MAG: hypothetical protein ACYCYP_12600 [Leptospirales bacterium]
MRFSGIRCRPHFLSIILLLLSLTAGCSSYQVILRDTVKPPLHLNNIQQIGVLVWPLDSPENRLFQQTMIRNIETIGGIKAVPISIPHNFDNTPLSVQNLAHLSQSNVLILLHILSHTVTDTAISNTGTCPHPPCSVLSVPMTVRTNKMTFHVAVIHVFPYKIYLDKTIIVSNHTHKVPLSLFSRHFEPLKTLNLKLYGQISQHIAYLFYPVNITLKRPFYPFDHLSRKAFESLKRNKSRLALFFLNSDYSLYLKNKETVPYRLYFNLGVVYESLGTYSLSDYYYRKGLALKNKKIFVRLEHQVRSFLVYFIGINFFEEGT